MKPLFALIFIFFLIKSAGAQGIKYLTGNNSWSIDSLSSHKAVLDINNVTVPYIPLEVNNKTISLPGRKIILNNNGLPAQIQTFFTEPLHFHVTRSDHKDITWKNGGIIFTDKQPGVVQWSALNTSDSLDMAVNASAEYDGYLTYTVKFTAKYDLKLDNIRLHIPFTEAASQYMIGLGQKGGSRPDRIDWKWDAAGKNEDGAWIGDVNAGLQYSLRDNHYISGQKPLILPVSWGNEGKGGIQIFKKGTAILADNYSGERLMKKGETLYYNFALRITPVHSVNKPGL